MDLGLKGMKAIVTGGTRGIGLAIAQELAQEGCHVGICARDATGVAGTVDELTANGITATGKAVDVSDGAALKAWVQDAGNELDGLDIVVASASGFGINPDDAAWRKSSIAAFFSCSSLRSAWRRLSALRCGAAGDNRDSSGPHWVGGSGAGRARRRRASKDVGLLEGDLNLAQDRHRVNQKDPSPSDRGERGKGKTVVTR